MPNKPTDKHQKSLTEIEQLRAQIQAEKEWSEVIGDIDALVVPGKEGIQVLSKNSTNFIYQNIIQEMSQGTITVTIDGLILYANKKISDMLKVPLEKVIGSTLSTWFGTEAHNSLQTLIQNCLKEGAKLQELSLSASDGAKVPVLVSITKLYIKEIPPSLCLMITDLTEIKRKDTLLDTARRTRQALLSLLEDEREANFKNLLAAKVFEINVEGIIYFDSKSIVTLVNKAFTLISGYTEDEILGQPLSILHPSYEKEAYYEDMKKSINLSGHAEAEIYFQRKDGRKILIQLSITRLLLLSNNEAIYIAIIQDVTTIRAHEKKIEWLAYHDSLTQLPNRTLFLEQLKSSILQAGQNQTKLAIILLNIDLFKRINDTFGPAVADKLLIEVSKRLQLVVGKETMVFHLGGDTFTILLTEDNIQKVTLTVNNIVDSIKHVFKIENNELYITVSIGISFYPDDGEDPDTLYKSSEITMFKVKSEGRDGFLFTNKATHTSLSRMLNLENALFHALKNQEFYLLYQPQISLQDGHTSGVEALIRWQHPEYGLITPSEFIPLAERTGQIVYIGEWVLRTAINQLKTWMDSGLKPFNISVNISARQFYQTNFCEMVNEILRETKLAPKYLSLELTEGMFIGNPHTAFEIMTTLNKNGILFELDDFGTGYSSLGYLANLPFSRLKIDKSFITKVETDNSKQNVVIATISLAKSFGMKTIAEGAETKEEVEYLRKVGCDEIQGYYFAKPMTAVELEAFLKAPRSKQ